MPSRRSLLLLFLVLAACAHLSVLHLAKAPWTPGQKTHLEARHWTFVFQGGYEGDRLVLHGTAYIRESEVPSWATWAQDLWIQAYLSDSSGRVLAKDLRLYLPLDIRNGVPLNFHLQPASVGSSGPLSISFGYRMELTAGRSPELRPAGLRDAVFFASQGAFFQ